MRKIVLVLDTLALLCAAFAVIVRVVVGPYSILRALVWTATALFACSLVADMEDNRR